MADPDRHLTLAIERAWPLLERLVTMVQALLGMSDGLLPDRVSRQARIAALRLLRPAEALMRRIIVVMAHDISVSPPSALSPIHVSHKAVSRDQTSLTRKAPQTSFRLFEPIPSFAACFGPPAAPTATGAAPPKPVIAAGDSVPSSPLAARLKGLEAVIAAPAKRAQRFAGVLARKAAEPFRAGRTHPLRPGWPPGSRSRHTPVWLKDLLLHLTRETGRGPPAGRGLTGHTDKLHDKTPD